MPTVKGTPGPYCFYFYSFDCNEPVYVHVQSEKMSGKTVTALSEDKAHQPMKTGRRLPAKLADFSHRSRVGSGRPSPCSTLLAGNTA